MEFKNIFFAKTVEEWREHLLANYQKEREIWLIFPLKNSEEKGISYNDAVEVALCFGWIDSTVKFLDERRRAQRFTPRRKGSPYSRPNIERLINMNEQGLIVPEVRESVKDIITAPYVFPADIIDKIKEDKEAWKNFVNFTEPYKRIRVSYVDAARHRPEEFQKRLNNFIEKTRNNKIITGYGGVDKYYKKN